MLCVWEREKEDWGLSKWSLMNIDILSWWWDDDPGLGRWHEMFGHIKHDWCFTKVIVWPCVVIVVGCRVTNNACDVTRPKYSLCKYCTPKLRGIRFEWRWFRSQSWNRLDNSPIGDSAKVFSQFYVLGAGSYNLLRLFSSSPLFSRNACHKRSVINNTVITGEY